MSRADIYYRAMLARDHRFDGKFFVGVKTTGIYCRPICPAGPPKPGNVEFFPTALAAEKHGFRPCLRCRPECAPGSPAWNGKSAVVQRALRLLAASQRPANEDELADKVGMTARHLRRLFEQELGRTPKQIADANRLDFARKLVMETELGLTEIAFAAGFRSLRRFNDAFIKRFHRPPSRMRRRSREDAAASFHELTLAFRPPFDWASLFQFHRRHAIGGLERFEDETYERLFLFEGSIGIARVSLPDPERAALRVAVRTDNPRALLPITRHVRGMFDLDSDPLWIANPFREHAFLAGLWRKYPGLRLPRGWDAFETAVSTILGQLVSVEQGGRLVAQLVSGYGRRVGHPLTGETAFLFPSPAELARADLLAVKTTGARRQTIRELARRVSEGSLDLSETRDPAAVKAELRAIPGIGPWSAEYIALRALGDTDAFPGTDLILKRAIERHPELELERVRPWRGYLAIYLWKEYAASLSRASKGGRQK